jgi:solute:Na+ symporter, SSS family
MHELHDIATSTDWIVLVIYVSAILLFGAYFSKYNKDTTDFFFGGRRFTWWLVAISIVATGVSSHSFIKYSAKGFQYGFSSTMAYMNDWFFMPFFMFGWLPIIIYSKVRSIPEYFERRFSPFTRFLVTVIQLVYLVGYIGIGFLTMAKALLPMMPESISVFGMNVHVGLTLIVTVIAIITGSYITFGGQTAVIFTDLLQGIKLLLSGILIFILGLVFLGGWGNFWHSLPTEWKLPLAHFNNPPDFNFIGIFWQDAIGGSVFFTFLNMGLVMRFMATKNVQEGRKAAAFNILFMLPLSAFVVSNAGWLAKAISVSRPDLIPADTNPDYIFVVVTKILAFPGLFGFLIATLVGALTTTISALLNAAAAIYMNDVEKTLKKWLNKGKVLQKPNEKKALLNARLATAVFTLFGALAVIPYNTFKTVYEAHGYFEATITPPLVVAIMFGVFWRKYSSMSIITTLICGISFMILGFHFPYLLIRPFAHGTPFTVDHPYMYVGALYNLLACFIVALLATLLQDRFRKGSDRLKKVNNHKTIITSLICFSLIVILMDILELGSVEVLFSLTCLMTIAVALIASYYTKYDAETHTAGLTVWSVRQAKEWFKGRKLNEREGKKVKMSWKLKESDEDEANFSVEDMKLMSADPGDLVYISDARKYLGGLKSVHTSCGEPHNETGIVYISKRHLEHSQFVEGRVVEADKEM